ncbi:GntR family transcriptional regulator [Rhodobaculum claviforme]|uniref:HTH gntR-type domain-containing protein n=1 Tax=Rhodobaculum claviforme TaxID=1549854 RepID=A0A934TLA6_9RHOB|nr:GntR family transcriptional regulator [Rhodobaculum claviforme]MBK5927698.1 hypothetical protein [Rhodobaculum claviforme]
MRRDDDQNADGTSSEQTPSSKPLHIQVREALETRITTGVHPVGALLPTEIDLAREFETSRFTIREAMRHLQSHGYVERRQGVGTRVISAHAKARYALTAASLDEIFRIGHAARLDIRAEETVVLDSDMAEVVGGIEGETWLCIRGLRRSPDGSFPLVGVDAYLPERLGPLVPYLLSHPGPWFTLLEEKGAGMIETTVQEISARPLASPMADWLSRPPGHCAMRMLRRYATEEGVILTAVNWHPHEEMVFSMELQRTDLLG